MTRHHRARAARGAAIAVALAVLLTGCNWSMARFDAAGTGYNPQDTGLNPTNVGSLTAELSATVAGATTKVPVVAGSTAYVTAAGSGLSAIDLNGAGCTGTPLVCQPLWTAAAGTTPGQAIVAGGTVFVGVGGALHAYDAAGVTGCAGSPKVCQPLWTAPGWGGASVAADGRVYANNVRVVYGPDDVAAFDQAGVTGCAGTPKVCAPLWTYDADADPLLQGLAPPAVADGVLYVGTSNNDSYINGGDFGSIQAFDATGTVGCTGTPTICMPRWRAGVGAVPRSPAVVDGVVYVASISTWEDEENGGGTRSNVDGFPAATCWANGSCAPTWHVRLANSSTLGRISVANGLLHAAGPDGKTWTYATTGGSPCGGTYPCEPLRRSPGTGISAVTDNLLYVGTRAFDVTGSAGCAGSPVQCSPQWAAPSSSGAAIPTNGKVLVWGSAGGTSTLTLYGLP